MITREMFVNALGFEPEQDDLDRCNCKMAGELGHFFCGWDGNRNKPNFIPDEPAKIYSSCARIKA